MSGRRRWAWLHDALWAAAIALAVFQGLRRWCGDRYRVPSDSMEPVLHGDPANGDIVFVDKLARADGPRRGDLVVVWHPEERSQPLVKRVAADGDDAAACWIDLRDGDVWLGPDPQHLAREVKDLPTARQRRVSWAAWPGLAVDRLELGAAQLGAQLELPPLPGTASWSVADLRPLFAEGARQQRRTAFEPRAVPEGFIGSARAIDATFVERTGVPARAGDDVGVHDCGMELEFATCPERLVAALDSRREVITFVWTPASGELLVWRDGEDLTRAQLPVVAAPRLLEFGCVDDQLFFVVDRRTDATWCMPRARDWSNNHAGIGGPRAHVYVGAIGATALRVSRLLVFHDLFVFRERIAGMPGQVGSWPRFVPAGAWFLLGDNAFDSRDSRHFDAVPRSAFVGRPWAVLGPWPWSRWLQP